jgi:transketolase
MRMGLDKSAIERKALEDISNILRRDVLKMTTAAGSGHPTSCLSCAEIMSTLFFSEMKYDIGNAMNPDNDEFILSKGHAAPILYSALFRAGCVKKDLMTLRKFGSPYEGHPMPEALKWVKVATGSLGQGLAVGIGMALAAKMQGRDYRTYVLMGDSECAEGSVFEAMALASYYKLSNLCIIIDVNRLGQTRETMLGHNIEAYASRIRELELEPIPVNGHDISELLNAFNEARKTNEKPVVILAKTYKGKGVSFLEDKEGWHGKALTPDELEKALMEVPEPKMPRIKIQRPQKISVSLKKSWGRIRVEYGLGEPVATREAYGNALVKLAEKNQAIVAIDAEVSNSTYSSKLAKAKPERYIESFIAEQSMIGIALGLSKKGFNVFASTFAAFLSRAHDQIRMAGLSGANFTICGSHAGISIGEDGPSQMGLEDLAMFRALPGSIVLYPSDAVSAEKLVELASEAPGIKYIRTTRPKTPVLYSNHEKFELGGFKVLRYTHEDKIAIIGAGITVYEALKAHDELEKQGINARVIDLYSVKPLNSKKLYEEIKRSNGKAIVVEDHYPQGGIGEALSRKFNEYGARIECLAVKKMPCSGKEEELMKYAGIDSEAIVAAAKKIMKL